ncbi:YihY/virulence factor BrkB family protein [Streptomyces sp. SID3343]|uniref:YihY/virulence factor BrkB family protein n=1 Tax=Streptomyces sp. SID3343 TaxID=2690260 RepID=UPI00136CEE05|nr:YihY/virulence factor BrkB family protein [Streptomyces sp. SID3343]MYW00511.1 YihY family inner membrane protein [Streptomyces sp. SID3343]
MGTVTRVPQTRDMKGEELSADEAWATLRRYGGWALVRNAFVRFRYADGFTHARALALQAVLSVLPLAIAVVGLSRVMHTDKFGRVVSLTLSRITEGPSSAVVQDTLRDAGEGSAVALSLGLLFSLVNLTTAMSQIERGANRIYGVERDRPFVRKYGRASVMTLVVGVPIGLGVLLTVAGGDIVGAVADVYGWGHTQRTVWNTLRRPLGIMLALISASAVFRWSPRRKQPGYTWLAFGATVYLVLWVLLTWLLGLYIRLSGSFDSVYGPLSAFVSLILWAYLTSIALFLGLAFAAQLEAVRAHLTEPVRPDPGV